MAFLDQAAVNNIGFAEVGNGVLIDETAQFYNPDRIRIGDNVRIDALTCIGAGEAGIRIGSHIHIGRMVNLSGPEVITLEDFTNLSHMVCIFSASDDYLSGAMTNVMIPETYKNSKIGPVLLRKHVIVGCQSVIMPGVTLGQGAAVGALTYVDRDIGEFAVVSGKPMQKVAERGRDLLTLEQRFLAEWQSREKV